MKSNPHKQKEFGLRSSLYSASPLLLDYRIINAHSSVSSYPSFVGVVSLSPPLLLLFMETYMPPENISSSELRPVRGG
jgi:hypothetical protein